MEFIKKHRFIIFIILIASFFRLYRIGDYMEFLGDQGRDIVIVRDFLKNGNFFFIGPQTSTGNMYLGPFYYYFIAPSLLLANFNPIGPAIFIALLGILTTYLVYFISKIWFNHSTALIASFFFAISPTIIKYSNFSWNPNVMPLFALLFAYFIWKSFSQDKFKNLIYATLSFIMALNAHYLALLLLPIPLIYFTIYLLKKPTAKNKKNFFKYLAISSIIFLISLIPQIAFDIKHQGQNIGALITFFSQRQTTVNLKAYKAIPIAWPLFTQINGSLLAGKIPLPATLISLFIALSSLFYLFKNFSQIKKNLYHPGFLLMFWYFFGLIGLGLYKQHIYDHYFGFLFPVVTMLTAFLITYIFQIKIYGKIISVLIFLIIVFQSFSHNQFLYQPPRQLWTTKQIVQSIQQKSNQEPFNLALLAKQNYDPPYRYFFYQNKAPLYDLKDKITNQLFVICEPWQIECQPINNPEWAVAAFGWAKIESQWEINGIQIFRLIHNLGGTP
ncbi:hypothetical protein A2192_02240 [Candidatus Nomurabacteria bacterium RIFOXYA1_FULL_35_17]|nr:MAG: hypothetical protein A2192_02240 [Candidatus Nomurabacteria bacterium RIFOXYA1_FULL_35_17]